METRIINENIIHYTNRDVLVKLLKINEDEYLWVQMNKVGGAYEFDYAKVHSKEKTKKLIYFFKGCGNISAEELFEKFDNQLVN
jgi:hypothetical protein